MSRASKDQVTVQRLNWRDNNTGEREQVIVIRRGNVFVRIPFDQARQVVDQVHDLCDARDRQRREYYQL